MCDNVLNVGIIREGEECRITPHLMPQELVVGGAIYYGRDCSHTGPRCWGSNHDFNFGHVGFAVSLECLGGDV